LSEVSSAMSDVILVWHYDKPNNETLRAIYPPNALKDAEALTTFENERDGGKWCPYDEHPALCRGTYIEEVNYGIYQG
jgi:hypothetical protein